MKIKIFFVLVAAAVCTCAAAAQNVVITPKKTTYRRPKAEMDFKRTFTIRRPIVKAATPALSTKITRAISPESVLQINMKEELGEYQWLEEADYKVLYNANGIICVSLWMTGTAAYPDTVTHRVVVDMRTGNRVRVAEVFQNLPGLAGMIRKAQKIEIAKAIEEIKKQPDAGEVDPSELFSESNYTAADLKEFSVNADGVTFYYDYGFPHVIEALQPAGEFKFTWSRLKPFVKPGGLLARFVR
jgi:hypothetical protein